MRPCPLPLKVLCILGICWAALGLISILGSLAMHFVPLPGPPGIAAMKKEPLYIAMTFGLGLASIVVDLLLLFGSIKSLKVEKSGQTLLIAYVWSKLAISAVGFVWSFGYLMPRTYSMTMPVPGPGPGLPPGFEAMMKAIMYISAFAGVLMVIAMPIYILITLRLRSVRDAYQGIFVPGGNFEPLMQTPAA